MTVSWSVAWALMLRTANTKATIGGSLMPKAEFDAQGKLFWHLARKAGWNQDRVNKLLLKRYKTTHWNALTAQQKSGVIATMQSYATAAEMNRMKSMPGIRQNIMAMVARNGYDKDWLHEQMESWGHGSSLRALGYSQLLAVRQLVIKSLNSQKEASK
jgi:hypothetical protein